MKVIYDTTNEVNGIVRHFTSFGRDIRDDDPDTCIQLDGDIITEDNCNQNYYYVRDGVFVELTDDEKSIEDGYRLQISILYDELKVVRSDSKIPFLYNGHEYDIHDITNIMNTVIIAFVDPTYTTSFVDVSGVMVGMGNDEIKLFSVEINNYKKNLDDLVLVKRGEMIDLIKNPPVIV